MHAYDTKDLKRLFGLPATTVRSLERAGYLNPVKRAGRLHYSFQDLIVLRTASALRAANIPAKRINRTLERLRASMPEGTSLNRLSLTALGDRIAVRDGRMLWESDSGQYVLALEIDLEQGGLHVLEAAAPAAARGNAALSAAEPALSAEELFSRGDALEETNPAAARIAYEESLELDPQHLEARINLGRLLHLDGDLAEAERVYRASAAKEPMIVFNLAVLLEDLHREPEAIETYREALALDPQLADAHFNLARLFERARNSKASLRHLLAYRRMTEREGA
ncbi:MAG TPA: tetratricopeptide repeat protein [Steroidobacteraceae bacterium]|nr:tetratricopeptide repeat protein [Steroidobacteraceae bacterium]